MTEQDVLALPVSIDVPTAARAMGIGRSTAYELINLGEFPIHVLKLGSRYRVRRSDLLEYLGIQP